MKLPRFYPFWIGLRIDGELLAFLTMVPIAFLAQYNVSLETKPIPLRQFANPPVLKWKLIIFIIIASAWLIKRSVFFFFLFCRCRISTLSNLVEWELEKRHRLANTKNKPWMLGFDDQSKTGYERKGNVHRTNVYWIIIVET